MKSDSTGQRPGLALHMLHRAGQYADELFAASIGESTLTPRQFAVLKAVAGNKEPSQTVLVNETGIDRSTLADIVRRLVSRGLLSRQRAKHDARAYVVKVTAAGSAAIRRAEPAARKTDERLLSALSANERAVFLKALTRIVETDPA
jgi:DNA-binding MarR family transcriptional regulator